MGQGASIIEYDYHNMNQLLGQSPQLITGEWKRNFTPSEATYWEASNNKIKAGVRVDEWPLKQPSDEHFTFGHHYFYVTGNGTEYHYDADNDNWVSDQPPEHLNEFVDQWKELLTSAEEAAGETTTAVTQKGEIKHSRNTRNQSLLAAQNTHMPNNFQIAEDDDTQIINNQQIAGQNNTHKRDQTNISTDRVDKLERENTQMSNHITMLMNRIDKLEKQNNQMMQKMQKMK